MKYEPTIGLEVHAHLDTETKMFCSCRSEFGAEPNRNTCPVCSGMPGALPVPNGKAVGYAIKIALALDCCINQSSTPLSEADRHSQAETTYFDRKNYYYPDMPKNYQISQSHSNLGEAGHLDVDFDGQTGTVTIDNVHLEEDSGKLVHDRDGEGDCTEIDLNRAGRPLVEIVTNPDMHDVRHVEAFMKTFRSMLLYMGVSDPRMQEGALRFEAGVSVAPAGSDQLGPRCEIKNLNSMKAVSKAVEYEINRQRAVLEDGGETQLETRLWDEEREVTARMRTKETAADYRYFPEPDLPPLRITRDRIQQLRAELPEFAHQRRSRFRTDYCLSDYDAGVLVADPAVADYFEELACEIDDAKTAANWIMTEVMRQMNDLEVDMRSFSQGVSAGRLAELIRREVDGALSHAMAKKAFARMARTGDAADVIIRQEGMEQISDTAELTEMVNRVVAEHPEAVEDLEAGKSKATGFLVGQVMRSSGGKANPRVVEQILKEKFGM